MLFVVIVLPGFLISDIIKHIRGKKEIKKSSTSNCVKPPKIKKRVVNVNGINKDVY